MSTSNFSRINTAQCTEDNIHVILYVYTCVNKLLLCLLYLCINLLSQFHSKNTWI